MSPTGNGQDGGAHGSALLPRELSERELDAAQVLPSVDALIIEDLTAEEDDAFAAALSPYG